jgi:hypothetical protein
MLKFSSSGVSVYNLTAERTQLLGPFLEPPPFIRHPKGCLVWPPIASDRRHVQHSNENPREAYLSLEAS